MSKAYKNPLQRHNVIISFTLQKPSILSCLHKANYIDLYSPRYITHHHIPWDLIPIKLDKDPLNMDKISANPKKYSNLKP